MARDPETRFHREWLGFVQPVGLLVSPPALVAAGAHPNKNVVPDHRRFLDCLDEIDIDGEPTQAVTDLPRLLERVFEWEPDDLVRDEAALTPLEVVLEQYDETLRPTCAVRELNSGEEAGWLMLVKVLPHGTPLDEVDRSSGRHWQATPHARFERLLRENGVPIGLLVNGTDLRLVYAPRGETSGYATFRVPDMAEVAGRPIFAALQMLLSQERLFTLGEKQRLPHILAESRRYQNTVSTKLAEQVLGALFELLRGFQAADDRRGGELLREVLDHDPDRVYAGLLTTLLRLVFVLYAEDRGLFPDDAVYVNHHGVSGLFERLREDAGRHPDTMDQRYGAWAQLLVLFRSVHDGARHGEFRMPPRRGHLFDPDRFPFLEGRPFRHRRVPGERVDPPHVSDGVVYRVLAKLLVLDGERLSYRTLDVEQIGSVYETMMGFTLEVAHGRSIALKPKKRHGAPVTVDLEELLALAPGKRGKWLQDHGEQKLTGKALKALKDAETPEEAVAALGRKVHQQATPHIVPARSMILQPSEERRRSGSHYTPRSLTEPIVRTTLEPILERLRTESQPSTLDSRPSTPTPEQILALKVCDPAMGSGAFLVEACRQLGDALVEAWHAHDRLPTLPPDEDEVLHARRLVAQRCLYGVDKNPMATDLAKLSLWLATLAKEHPFTFLDHALRTGDSLVGLSKQQIQAFHWEPAKQMGLEETIVRTRIQRASEYRREILEAREDAPYRDQEQRLAVADEALSAVRLVGDAVVSAFFAGKKKRDRRQRRDELFEACSHWMASGLAVSERPPLADAVAELKSGAHPVTPFHWEIEFPEVFDRENGGFDAFVGNPPFLGGARVWPVLGPGYPDWLRAIHSHSHGKAVDLVAHFFRRAYRLLRTAGCLGLVATNSIAQGDTRVAGLRWICRHFGSIYTAHRRLRWPGSAAVVVSVIHISKETGMNSAVLDGKDVSRLNSYLFPNSAEFEPVRLKDNQSLCFQGACVLGMGFTFDDADSTGAASSLKDMKQLIDRDPKNAHRIFPYIGGKEVNTDPQQAHHRYVIDFGDMSLEDASRYPDLLQVVKEKVKPSRDKIGGYSVAERRREYWWQFGTATPALNHAKSSLDRVLVIARISNAFAPVMMPSEVVFNEKTLVFAMSSFAAFALVQCRLHEMWARFFGSTLKDDFQYTPSDCLETYPFPMRYESNNALECAGCEYHQARADLMVRNDEGLTKTYNRFHDRYERSPEIARLRELHADMDRAVLEAYGWHDLAQTATCEFLLDYEEPEDDEDTGRRRKRKKPWRYRWPDDFRDEVLARLLELNQQRAEEERLAGLAAKEAAKAQKKRAGVAISGEAEGVERDRERFYILMLLRAWGRPLTRHALDTGLILMLNDDIRAGLLGRSSPGGAKAAPRVVEGLDYVLQEMKVKGWVKPDSAGPQQVLTILPEAPPTDSAPEDDRSRISEVKQVFERERARGNVTETEELVDAKPDLVSA